MTLSLRKLNAALLVGVIGFSVNVFAKKILLISDIDDTIKVSRVVDDVRDNRPSNLIDLGFNFFYYKAFTGMSELYNSLKEQNGDNLKIVYLSSAPEAISKYHVDFLKANNFPKGTQMFRNSVLNKTHKIDSIRKLMETEKPEKLILIGDNGEKDALIYHEAFNEFKDTVEISSYIHLVYSTDMKRRPFAKLNPEQKFYVTPIELALDFNKEGLLNDASVANLTDLLIPKIVNEKNNLGRTDMTPLSFPQFKNCSEYKNPYVDRAELTELNKKIAQACRIAN